MAQLVQLIGVQHNPILIRRFQQAEKFPGAPEALRAFGQMREALEEARPDVILVVGNDHLNQWFMDNMPAFLVGKAPIAAGPFPHEREQFGLEPYEVPVEVGVAKRLIEGGYWAGVDFAYSDEFTLDHAFVVPLSLIHPRADVPIVPIFSNVMAPPMPPAQRFYEVGQAMRRVIEDMPGDARVAVVASGHLSVEIGGPRFMVEAPDPEFDAEMIDHIGHGHVDALLGLLTPERMTRAGNLTAAAMNFALLVGLAGGQPATRADYVLLSTSTTPFLSWDLHKARP
ncbi:MAG TPA: 2,3-dihydroxybiphenyl 1,2-dioxygenase [Chloroflexota bacterium]|nr:2,3-dihydroxybiphenyl 1,2-dioxygenase [Chloroflexota bacterium]